jgi:hypothetical protein
MKRTAKKRSYRELLKNVGKTSFHFIKSQLEQMEDETHSLNALVKAKAYGGKNLSI